MLCFRRNPYTNIRTYCGIINPAITLQFLSYKKRGDVVQRNSEVRSRNHCCSGKAMSIIHSECVFVALFIQHEMRKRHIDVCGLSGPTKVFHIIS